MSSGESAHYPDARGRRLNAELATLRADYAGLREACAQLQQMARRVREESGRIRADCRRSRGEILRASLPRDASCGAVARRLVEEHLSVADDELANAKTVVTELAINAFQHGTGRIELRVSSRGGRARLEVTDEGQGLAGPPKVSDGSHGLDIVDGLSLAWGAAKGSSRVWAVLAASAPRPDDASTPPDRIEEELAGVRLDSGYPELEPVPGA
jgi:anti-sigma regulatory factor (Ser/Thr protein kinase)